MFKWEVIDLQIRLEFYFSVFLFTYKNGSKKFKWRMFLFGGEYHVYVR